MQDFTGELDILGDFALRLAVHGAESGVAEIHRQLLNIAGQEDDRPGTENDGLLIQDTNHAGTPAKRIDAAAREAVRGALLTRFEVEREMLGARVGQFFVIGEEEGTPTQILRKGALIARTDPLDGTTNAVNTLSSFASVVSIDYVRDPEVGVRHLAGAIMGGDFDLCWQNQSPRSIADRNRYSRLEGRVYVRSQRLGMGWQRLQVEEENRSNSVASVAASHKRFTAFEGVRTRIFSHDGVVYHLAGNPLWAGLLMGQVGSVVETQNVTLHDSVFLIPHSLLGGRVEDASGGVLDYLKLYEANATSFDPARKPVPPHVAYCGGVDRSQLLSLGGPAEDSITTIPTVEEVDPIANNDIRSVELPDEIF